VSIACPRTTLTIARVRAVEITLAWRWMPVLGLGTWLLARNVLPARFPTWDLGTTWLAAAAVVLACELGLLLHELGHVFAAQGRGQEVLRIVFHGFRAETVCRAGLPAPAHEAVVALVGPGVNLALAGLLAAVRYMLATDGPLDVVLLLLVMGNAAMAFMNLVPIGDSDGGRALSAFRLRRSSGSR